jgi:hypothetical protein
MAKYTSGRQKNLKVGLTSYSESKTSLEVIGKVGIGTTNATSSLHVVGNQFVTGIITASSFSGTATTSITAGSAKTATDVIGGIASVTSLFVNTSGISTLGTVKISSGIVTAIAGSAVTFFGTFVGTASTASFATTAFSLQGFDFNTSTVGSAKTATDVIGGIGSLTQLSVSGVTTVGVLTATRIGIGTTNPTSELVVIGDIFSTGITTLGTVKISSGIITSTNPGFSTVTYFGDLKGNSDTTGKLKTAVNIGGVSFDGSASISLKGVNTKGDQDTDGTAASAANLNFGVSKGIYFRDSSGSNATTSNNLTFDGNNLKVSGITTVGGVGVGNTGIKIDGTTGIISSSNPGVTTVTYYGTLIGTAQVDVTNITNTSNVIGGIASVTSLSVSGSSTVGVLTAIRIGIGTTNPTSELWVDGNVFFTGISTLGSIKISSGIITSTNPGVSTVLFVGNLTGTASTASFATTAFTLNNRTESQFNVAFASTAGIATFATKSGVSTDVIGGIASVSSLFVDLTGISTLGTVKISSGIVTAIAGSAVTFFGTFVGTATSAGFAQTAFNLDSSASANIKVGFATTATNVIGGIASVSQLSVSGVSTVGVLTATRIGIGTTNPTVELFVVGNSNISGIVTVGVGSTGVVINGISGIITSIGITTVTYFGNLTGTASTASFATTAFNLNASSASNLRVGFATTATDVIGGIASVSQLSVSGVSTVGVLTATRIGIGTTNPTSELFVVGNSRISGIVTVGLGSTGVVINGISGIITSSNPGVTTVTYFGDGSNLTGIRGVSVESQAQVTQPVFPTLAVNSGVNSIGIATTGSTALSFNSSTGSLGIGTTNPTSKLFVNGNAIFGGTGIVTAVEYNGNLRIGTPEGGFKSGAVGIVTADFTKNSINDINSILGKLVPKPPTTIAGVTLTLTGFTGTGFLCSGFTPTNNTGGLVTPTAGTVLYNRNSITNTTISSTDSSLQQYGPGDSGTVTAFINSVGVGTTTLSSGSNNGTYGSLVISNDRDASFATLRNTGITSGFYEIYDAKILNAPSPNGFNFALVQQGTSETTKPFWYQDPSTVSAPVLSTGAITIPSIDNHVVLYSSGLPHYTEDSGNDFTYILTCQNASGDMYTRSNICATTGATSGFQSPIGGDKTYVDFGGSAIPTKNFGVSVGVTTVIRVRPLNTHIQLTSPVSFPSYTAQTPYGTSGTPSVTLTKTINIMGNSASVASSWATTAKIDENAIGIIGITGSGNASRTNAGAGDNPSPIFTSWDETTAVATHEATVVGGILKHDTTNYNNGSFLPAFGPFGSPPDYSVGRTGSQYFQVQIIRSAVSSFKINVVGTYSSCWVCMPQNDLWKTSLSDTNGWADMFKTYGNSGPPSNSLPGCALDVMTGNSGTFRCTFGGRSSSEDTGTRILVRWKLLPGQAITAMAFSANI